ncbi:hypothetical protein SAMN02910344_00212 [Ruminobacter amylophilus]|uniref:Uncharacterized protein n=1 Tax=Ruminobacter amylophilus TaxID=867 RepID=A0A662ZEI8_9GAMM|nr:hypothetical protein [Ruminobacter amylophilus]SFP01882.1 hypothetical protein SAMN02910344_00212 [Ruminobacter amylophilus]
MLLIHLLPFNRDNYPWCVDIISVNPENAEILSQSRIVVTPPAGICPSPTYAVSFDCDCIEAVRKTGLNPAAAAERLAMIIKNHERLVFSGKRAYLMFRELLCNLQMRNVLKNKRITSFKSIVHAAVSLKGIYYPQAWNNIKKLGAETGNTDNRYIRSMYAVFKDLYLKAPKLLSYFVNKSLVLDTAESSGKIILGIGEDSFFIFTPVMVTSEYVLGISIVKEIKPLVLPVNGAVCYTVSSAINTSIARELKTDFEQIKKLHAESSAYLRTDSAEYLMLMDNLESSIKNESEDVLASDEYRSTESMFAELSEWFEKDRDVLSADEVCAHIARASGRLRTAMMDYLYSEDYPLPLGYDEVYRDIVSARISNARDNMVAELEYATAQAEKNSNQQSLQRLANLYRYLSE